MFSCAFIVFDTDRAPRVPCHNTWTVKMFAAIGPLPAVYMCIINVLRPQLETHLKHVYGHEL